MPIVRKSKFAHLFSELQKRIDNLKNIMEGKEPNENLWNFYALNEGDYKRDFTEIEQSELLLALGDVDNAIKELIK